MYIFQFFIHVVARHHIKGRFEVAFLNVILVLCVFYFFLELIAKCIVSINYLHIPGIINYACVVRATHYMYNNYSNSFHKSWCHPLVLEHLFTPVVIRKSSTTPTASLIRIPLASILENSSFSSCNHSLSSPFITD